MKKKLRLGTRTSELALWQCRKVAQMLEAFVEVEICGINTAGDKDLSRPIHEIDQNGVFTKAIDLALLNGEIDLGIHSLKDYPTAPPDRLELFAVLARDFYYDVLIPGKSKSTFEENKPYTIASGSPRRISQWLHRYPAHRFTTLRGNMATRLEKIKEHDGGIISEAGLQRLGIMPENALRLDWMIPAPGQGVIAIVGKSGDIDIKKILQTINDEDTFICTYVERSFMAGIEAGCSAPLGAFARLSGDEIHFHGILSKLNGSDQIQIKRNFPKADWQYAGKKYAEELLAQGGDIIMREIRQTE